MLNSVSNLEIELKKRTQLSPFFMAINCVRYLRNVNDVRTDQ